MDPIIYNTKVIINTFVRLMPIGLYFGTLIMGILFTDVRAFTLFVGYMVNDLISLGFRKMYQSVDLVNCSIVESSKNFYTLPSSHTQTIAFTLAYFFTDMYIKEKFTPINFIFLIFLLVMTMWSRINVGCENIVDALYAVIVGLLIGSVFYRLTQNWTTSPNDLKIENEIVSKEVEIYQRL